MSDRNPYNDEPARLSMPHDFPDYVDEITDIFRSEGQEIYLVGGSVRDMLLGIEPDDHDFAVSADAEEMIRICKKHGLDHEDQYSFLDYIIVKHGSDKIDLNRFKGGTLRSDMLRRDLTINALAYDVAAGEIIDYAGGLEDLKNGIIRFTDPANIPDKPENILRALRFSIKFGFRIDEDSYSVMQNNVKSFENIRTPALIKGMDKLLRDSRDSFTH